MEKNGQLMLELQNVSHSFYVRKASFEHGVHKVLDRVSLTPLEGETLGIIGRNSAPGTTRLRRMNGILVPSSDRFLRRPDASRSLPSLGVGAGASPGAIIRQIHAKVFSVEIVG